MPENEKVKWRDDPKGPYIRLASGHKFWLREPTPDQFLIRDIAYHTAGINRYTGGSRFSVAQHEVVGAYLADRFYNFDGEIPLLASRFLIHDAPEAMYGDMSSPLKALNPEYKRMLAIAEAAWEKRCDLTFVDDALVKEVDTRMWLTERLHVYRNSIEDISEDYEGHLEPFPLSDFEMQAYFGQWTPERAEQAWLTEMALRLPQVKW